MKEESVDRYGFTFYEVMVFDKSEIVLKLTGSALVSECPIIKIKSGTAEMVMFCPF